jgi:hypothetical protein
MRVDPKVIDLGWGELKSAITRLDDKVFLKPDLPKEQRQAMLNRYFAAFRALESGNRGGVQEALKRLSGSLADTVAPDARQKVSALIDTQLSKIG